jgi:ketosteroid isomerase-like protein
MKMRIVVLVTLVAMLGLPTVLCAQETDPLAVVNAMHDALLIGGDVNAALSYLADDAVVTIVSPLPGGGVYSGKEEVRGFWEALVAANFTCVLSDCRVEGETVSCINTYSDDGLRAAGVDSIAGTWVAIVRDGKVQSYTYTISEESLAQFSEQPQTLPETGSSPWANYASVIALGLLAVAGSLGVQWLLARSKKTH